MIQPPKSSLHNDSELGWEKLDPVACGLRVKPAQVMAPGINPRDTV